MLRRRKFWTKNRCQDSEFDCSVFFSTYWRIVSKLSLTWFDVDSLTLVIRWRNRRRREVGGIDLCFGLALATSFPVSSVIDVVLSGFLHHFRHVFVSSNHDHHPGTSSIAKNDLHSVTALTVNDNHLQSWTDLRVPSWVVSRKSTLSTRASQFVQFLIVEGREILSSSRSSWYLHWSTVWSIEDDLEELRIFVRNRAARFLALCHWSKTFCSLSTILLASLISWIWIWFFA